MFLLFNYRSIHATLSHIIACVLRCLASRQVLVHCTLTHENQSRCPAFFFQAGADLHTAVKHGDYYMPAATADDEGGKKKSGKGSKKKSSKKKGSKKKKK
jgi:hypothetical protein